MSSGHFSANRILSLLISYKALYNTAEIIMWLLARGDSGGRGVEGCHHRDAVCRGPVFQTRHREIHIW